MCVRVTMSGRSMNFQPPVVSSKRGDMLRDQAQPAISAALFTDLYELTMAQAYDVEQLDKQAVFELAFRTLPHQRNFALAAGLDDVITALESWHFGEDELDYL